MSKVAAIQMTSTPDVSENLKAAELLIREAAENGAKLIVLPEMFAIAGLGLGDKLKVKEHIGHGPIQDFLSQQAKNNKVWIIGGTIPIACENENKIRAACLVYDDRGEMIARYDKIHLFDVIISDTESYKESNATEPGEQLVVVDTPVGKVGLAVCYDIRFPELFRSLANLGAEIFVLPSAFTMKTGQAHWEVLLRSRAIENFCYMIAPAQGGTHVGGRQTYGHSLVVEPWGTIVSEFKEPIPGVTYADIDLNQLRKFRQSIPVFEHQKIFFDHKALSTHTIDQSKEDICSIQKRM